MLILPGVFFTQFLFNQNFLDPTVLWTQHFCIQFFLDTVLFCIQKFVVPKICLAILLFMITSFGRLEASYVNPCMPVHLPTHQPAHLPTHLLAPYLSTYLPIHVSKVIQSQ